MYVQVSEHYASMYRMMMSDVKRMSRRIWASWLNELNPEERQAFSMFMHDIQQAEYCGCAKYNSHRCVYCVVPGIIAKLVVTLQVSFFRQIICRFHSMFVAKLSQICFA